MDDSLLLIYLFPSLYELYLELQTEIAIILKERTTGLKQQRKEKFHFSPTPIT